jgi:hypothetical protein
MDSPVHRENLLYPWWTHGDRGAHRAHGRPVVAADYFMDE